MQGSYSKDGLPRPYNMRPIRKKQSPYDKMPKQIFTTPSRKLVGYIIMLALIGMMIFTVSQELKSKPDPIYEVINLDAEKEGLSSNLASNLAEAPNGKVGVGLKEAPLGGIANEGVVVGAKEEQEPKRRPKSKGVDEEIIIDEEPAAAPAGAVKNGANKVKGYKASKEGEEVDKLKVKEA